MTDSVFKTNAIRFLGEEITNKLYDYTDDDDDLDQTVKLIMADYSRDPTKPLTENLIIAMVKVCVQSKKLRNAQTFSAAQELVNSLGLTDSVKAFVEDCLFNKQGLEGHGLRLFRL